MTVTADFDFINREMKFQDNEMVRFINSQQGMDKSESTVYKYAMGLEQYSEWLEKTNKSPAEVDFVDIQNYLAYLTNEEGYADKTVHIKYVPIRMFYSYLEKLDEISDNPADKVDSTDYYTESNTRREEESGQKRFFLSKEEIRELTDSVPAPRLRNRLLILFMYYTGLRRSEVLKVKLDNINREKRTVEVEVKGGENHTAVWHERLDGLMKQWIEYGYRDSYPTADESPYLFVTNSTEQLGEERIGRIVNIAAENSGLQETVYEDTLGRERKKISCHTLRHSFAMNFLSDGGSIEALSNRLAHSSVMTTEIYGEVQDDRGIEEYNQVMKPIETENRIEHDQCLLCGQKGNLQNHHISYQPEKIISVCNSCHQDIHDKDEYKHLQPDQSKSQAGE